MTSISNLTHLLAATVYEVARMIVRSKDWLIVCSKMLKLSAATLPIQPYGMVTSYGEEGLKQRDIEG